MRPDKIFTKNYQKTVKYEKRTPEAGGGGGAGGCRQQRQSKLKSRGKTERFPPQSVAEFLFFTPNY
jgi:hypothetical protein